MWPCTAFSVFLAAYSHTLLFNPEYLWSSATAMQLLSFCENSAMTGYNADRFAKDVVI